MELPLRDRTGKEIGTITVADEVFGLRPHLTSLHQVFVSQMANRRQGTSKTKTRGEVRGSTRKLAKQKGLGRARVGSARSPVRTGGGVAFGPRPRDYTQTIPKRFRRLALRSALSSKARDAELLVLNELDLATPKTKEIATMMEALGVKGSAIIVTADPNPNVKMSAANLPRVMTLPAAYLNVADLMNHRSLIMTEGAVRKAEALWGGERATKRRAAMPEGAR